MNLLLHQAESKKINCCYLLTETVEIIILQIILTSCLFYYQSMFLYIFELISFDLKSELNKLFDINHVKLFVPMVSKDIHLVYF